MGDSQRKSKPANDPQPYEHPSLEQESGFWDGKWSEFKRRFIKLAWEDDHSRTALILSTLVCFVTVIGSRLFGWG